MEGRKKKLRRKEKKVEKEEKKNEAKKKGVKDTRYEITTKEV